MDKELLNPKWILLPVVSVSTLLALNSTLDTFWLLSITNDRVQFGSNINSAVMYVSGWVAPVASFLASKKMTLNFSKPGQGKPAALIYGVMAILFSTWYVLMLWCKAPPVVALNDQKGVQILAYESNGFLGDSATIIERKKLIVENVFWIHELHYEPHSCDVSMTLMPDNIVKCVFVTGFWRKEPQLEVLLSY